MIEEVKPAPAPEPKKPNLLLRLLALLVTLALVVAGVAAVVYRDELNFDALRRWMRYRSLETSDSGQAQSFQYTGDPTNSFATLDGGLLVSSTTSIQLFSSGGVEYVNEPVSMENPVISVGKHTAAVYDAGGSALYAYADRKQVFSYTAEGDHKIYSARMNGADWLTLVAQESGYKAAVTVYNGKFQKVLRENISSSFVMDAVLSEDCKTLAVVTVDQQEAGFESTLTLYRLSDGEKMAACSLGDNVVLGLKSDEAGFWAVGDGGVSIVGTDGALLGSYAAGGLFLKGYALDLTDGAALLLGQYAGGGAGSLALVGADGSANTLNITQEVLSLSAAGRYLAVLTADKLTVYNDDLTVYAAAKNDGNTRRVLMRQDGSVMMIGASGANLFVPG